MFFDTHAHYDDRQFDKDRDAVIEDLQNHGISLVVNVGCDLTSSLKSVRLAEKYPFMYATVGCHPHDAKALKDSDLVMFEALCKKEKVVAVGEIGLDYHYDHSPRDVQRGRFVDQLELAERIGMPVVIHEREAHRDAMDIISQYADRVSGVFHCYSGALDQAKAIIGMGWFLSFTGAATFPNAKKAVEVIRWMPLDRLMLETDCPYLAPVPNRGRRNDSRNIPHIAARVAEIRNMDVEEIARITMENGKRFFGI